jgi:hypothetical protein
LIIFREQLLFFGEEGILEFLVGTNVFCPCLDSNFYPLLCAMISRPESGKGLKTHQIFTFFKFLLN